MLIIRYFKQSRYGSVGYDFEEVEFAVNNEGRIEIRPHRNGLVPSDNAFADDLFFVGLAGFTTKRLIYEFNELTEDFVKTLRFGTEGTPTYTSIVDDLGIRKCVSKPIERIYFI